MKKIKFVIILILTFIGVVGNYFWKVSEKVNASTNAPYAIIENSVLVVIGNGHSIVIESGVTENSSKVKYKTSNGSYTYIDLDPTQDGIQNETIESFTIYGGAKNASVDSIDITVNGGYITEIYTKGYSDDRYDESENLISHTKAIVTVNGGDVLQISTGFWTSSKATTYININGGSIGYIDDRYGDLGDTVITFNGGKLEQEINSNKKGKNTVVYAYKGDIDLSRYTEFEYLNLYDLGASVNYGLKDKGNLKSYVYTNQTGVYSVVNNAYFAGDFTLKNGEIMDITSGASITIPKGSNFINNGTLYYHDSNAIKNEGIMSGNEAIFTKSVYIDNLSKYIYLNGYTTFIEQGSSPNLTKLIVEGNNVIINGATEYDLSEYGVIGGTYDSICNNTNITMNGGYVYMLYTGTNQGSVINQAFKMTGGKIERLYCWGGVVSGNFDGLMTDGVVDYFNVGPLSPDNYNLVIKDNAVINEFVFNSGSENQQSTIIGNNVTPNVYPSGNYLYKNNNKSYVIQNNYELKEDLIINEDEILTILPNSKIIVSKDVTLTINGILDITNGDIIGEGNITFGTNAILKDKLENVFKYPIFENVVDGDLVYYSGVELKPVLKKIILGTTFEYVEGRDYHFEWTNGMDGIKVGRNTYMISSGANLKGNTYNSGIDIGKVEPTLLAKIINRDLIDGKYHLYETNNTYFQIEIIGVNANDKFLDEVTLNSISIYTSENGIERTLISDPFILENKICINYKNDRENIILNYKVDKLIVMYHGNDNYSRTTVEIPVVVSHDGGYATCNSLASCQMCGLEYGVYNMSNHEGDTHTNGFFDCCNQYYPAQLNNEGVYEISTVGQLFWFKDLVDSGQNDASAKLINDIDLENYEWNPIKSTKLYYDSEYSNEDYSKVDIGYQGVFDGNYHVIKNVRVTAISNETWSYGLFGTLSGTIKNLGIEGFEYIHNEASDMRTGAIVGQNLGGIIENCYVVSAIIAPEVNVAGGIAGCNYNGQIINSFVYNSIIKASSGRYGYIVGDNRADKKDDRLGTVENCYTDGNNLTGEYTGYILNSKNSVYNKYFSNGTITWKLNNESSNGPFKQGNEYPNFIGIVIDSEPISDEPANIDGVYQLGSKEDLFWFSTYVNFVNSEANAILKNNINLENQEWLPIGTQNTPYTGVFDGAGFEIYNFKMTITKEARAGLFGEINNSTIKNFTIKGEVVVNLERKENIYYGVIGVSSNSTISNVHSEVDLKVLDKFDKNSIAGIVGNITTSIIERSSFSGTINLGEAYVDCAGGIVGYSNYNNSHVITDCGFYGNIISNCMNEEKYSSGQIGGILGYYRGSKILIKNNISVGSINILNPAFTGMIGGRVLEIGSNINNIANNFYNGTLLAFSDTEDNSLSYWDKDVIDYSSFNEANAKYVSDFTTGEITYLLNEDQSSIVWYQTVGAGYPKHIGQKVYYGYISCSEDAKLTYTNNSLAATIKPEHIMLEPTCDAPSMCENRCGYFEGEKLKHIDENKDHSCDRNCGKDDIEINSHIDENNDHKCDYGCLQQISECIDNDFNHKCDNGCEKIYGIHEDINFDHNCDYGCEQTLGEHIDNEDNNHLCDYGCSKIADDGCYEIEVDGKCDECGIDIIHNCADEDKNHICNICTKNVGEHIDINFDHICDYGCSLTIGMCKDEDLNHLCDYGCTKIFGEHLDNEDNNHLCDYECGKIADGGCYDTNNDYICDECQEELEHNISGYIYDDKCHWNECENENCDYKGEIQTHQYSDWIITKEANELENGLKTKKCECGHEIYEEIPMLETPQESVQVLSRQIIAGIISGSTILLAGLFSIFWFVLRKRIF